MIINSETRKHQLLHVYVNVNNVYMRRPIVTKYIWPLICQANRISLNGVKNEHHVHVITEQNS